MDGHRCYYCSNYGPCPMCQAGPYRTASPPPPEQVYITHAEPGTYTLDKVDIVFRCPVCGNEWRLSDTFKIPDDADALQHLLAAWGRHHGRCVAA